VFKEINSTSFENKKMSTHEIHVCNYRLGKQLGSGSFGDIYIGHELTDSKRQVAIKLEEKVTKYPQIAWESRIYRKMANVRPAPSMIKYTPDMIWADSVGDFNVLILELMGSSLENQFKRSGRIFSVRTVLLLGCQMIRLIQGLHSIGYIHRDIKPDNFLLGRGDDDTHVYMIDFGLAKQYQRGTQHIPFRSDKSLTGTARYASLNTHRGFEQSRRDDMEAIIHVLLYFSMGKLPWQGLHTKTTLEKYAKIGALKGQLSIHQICNANVPPVLKVLYEYVRGLEFAEEPNYDFCVEQMKKELVKQGYDPTQNDINWSSEQCYH
jgi:serine/threonine protein kinase